MWIPKIDRNSDLFEEWLPYWKWEEFDHNMWGNVDSRKEWLEKAIELTGDHEKYGYWMLKVIEEWPNSSRHNLTKRGDKRAWIGHAAVSMAIKCPEDIVRAAWGMLTVEQQEKANKKADEAIDIWRMKNA